MKKENFGAPPDYAELCRLDKQDILFIIILIILCLLMFIGVTIK